MSRATRTALIVFAVALAVRVAGAAVMGIDGPPRGDERGYELLAVSLAESATLRLPVPADVLQALGIPDYPPLRAFRAPLLPLIYAPVVKCGGGLVAMRVLTLLIGAACAPLLLLSARRLTSERIALLAALAYAVWPPHVHVSLHALSEPLAMALFLPAIGLTAREAAPNAAQNAAPNAAPGDGGAPRSIGAGVLAGLSVLARPAMLLPALFLVAVSGSRRRVLLGAVGLALALAPWIVRNVAVVGAPVITTNSGVTLVGANCDAIARAKVPGKWLPPDQIYPTGGSAPDLGMWGWSELGEVESNRRFVSHALGFVTDQPGAWAELTGWKLVRLFDPDPRSSKPDAWWKAIVGWITVTPVLLLSLVGLRDVMARRAAWSMWLAPVAGTVCTALIFYGDTRMRAAADPTLLLLAATGLFTLLPSSFAGNSTASDGSG